MVEREARVRPRGCFPGSSSGDIATTFAIFSPAASACAATRSARFPPSEKACRVQQLPRQHRLDLPGCANDFRQQAGMKQLAVEMMRGTVIAQIQPDHIETPGRTASAREKECRGCSSCLPNRATGRRSYPRREGPVSRVGRRGLQAHAFSAVSTCSLLRREQRASEQLNLVVARNGRLTSSDCTCGLRIKGVEGRQARRSPPDRMARDSSRHPCTLSGTDRARRVRLVLRWIRRGASSRSFSNCVARIAKPMVSGVDLMKSATSACRGRAACVIQRQRT